MRLINGHSLSNNCSSLSAHLFYCVNPTQAEGDASAAQAQGTAAATRAQNTEAPSSELAEPPRASTPNPNEIPVETATTTPKPAPTGTGPSETVAKPGTQAASLAGTSQAPVEPGNGEPISAQETSYQLGLYLSTRLFLVGEL